MSSGNIFLVGLMGAGKTTIGRTLARRLNKRFIDSDHEIEARTGASIPWIFEIEGEANFRRREADVIRDLVAQDNIVLATGGGAILDPDSRRLLHERGTVVYLRSSVGALLARTAHDKNRPLLQTADPRRKLEELTAQRDPLYREIAHIVVESARPGHEREAPRADAPRRLTRPVLTYNRWSRRSSTSSRRSTPRARRRDNRCSRHHPQPRSRWSSASAATRS